METLRRTTPDRGMSDAVFIAALTQRVQDPDESPQEYHHFINDPLSIWIESTFGIRDDGHGRLVRQIPQSISGEHGAAARLSQITGVDPQQCAIAMELSQNNFSKSTRLLYDPWREQPVFCLEYLRALVRCRFPVGIDTRPS
jgi:hypothetical protein